MTIKEFEMQYALGALSDGMKIELAIKSASKEVLSMLSKDAHYNVRCSVAINKNTLIDILEILSKDEHYDVRHWAVHNPNYRVKMTIKEFEMQYALGALSDDEKEKLAKNKNTPKEILSILSKDRHIEVRYNVAGNKSTPIEILEVLSKDEDWEVRWSVADNPNYEG